MWMSEQSNFCRISLTSFLKNKTAIIIAHRLSTVRHVDRILVLKEGEVVEQGTYQELVDKRGEFLNTSVINTRI